MNNNNRIKLPTIIIDRARAETLLGEIAALKLQERSRRAEMDRRLLTVRAQYDEPLAAMAKQIEEKTAMLERWAAENPSEFPKGRKSIAMLHGTVGYRTGMPA